MSAVCPGVLRRVCVCACDQLACVCKTNFQRIQAEFRRRKNDYSNGFYNEAAVNERAVLQVRERESGVAEERGATREGKVEELVVRQLEIKLD